MHCQSILPAELAEGKVCDLLTNLAGRLPLPLGLSFFPDDDALLVGETIASLGCCLGGKAA